MEDDLVPKPKEEVISLPKATIAKIIKDECGEVKFSNSSIEIISKCCSEFIQLLSSQANEICTNQQKKTISPENVFEAIKQLGFEHYLLDLKEELETVKERKKKNKEKKKDKISESMAEHQQELFRQAKERQMQKLKNSATQ